MGRFFHDINQAASRFNDDSDDWRMSVHSELTGLDTGLPLSLAALATEHVPAPEPHIPHLWH